MCNVVCVGIGQFLAPMIIAIVIVAIIGAIFSAIGREIAGVQREHRARRAAAIYASRLDVDLARPLAEIRKERAQLNPSHAMDGDFWRPLWKTTYLDGIIAVRTWPDAALAKQCYPQQWKALEELNHKEASQAANVRRRQAFARFIRRLVKI